MSGEKLTTLDGADFQDWERANPTCPRCDDGELEAIPEEQVDRGEFTGTRTYECLECDHSFTHTPGTSLTWYEVTKG